MQDIEPYYKWLNDYVTEEDEYSPYFEKEYSQFQYVDTIYNHYIHPQWDGIESESLFVKILYADYEEGYAFIELIGEWNDTLHNDIALLKDNLLDILIQNGVNKLILIGNNVLTFHYAEEDYYEELIDNLEGGYIVGLNFAEHVQIELKEFGMDRYIIFNEEIDFINWRKLKPQLLFKEIDRILNWNLLT